MNKPFGIKLAFLCILFCYAATAGAEESSPVVVKVERAIERGAKATVKGVKIGVAAGERGVGRGMEATSKGIKRGAQTVERKVDASSTSSSATKH
ncbi:MAG: hypothetical protein ABIT70_00350 [Sulfuriferula sp.]